MENRNVVRIGGIENQTTDSTDPAVFKTKPFRHLYVTVVTDADFVAGTLKFYMLNEDLDNDAASGINYPGGPATVGFTNIESGSFVAGSTGLVMAASSTYNLELRPEIAHYVAIALSGMGAAGSVTAWLTGANNV